MWKEKASGYAILLQFPLWEDRGERIPRHAVLASRNASANFTGLDPSTYLPLHPDCLLQLETSVS